MKKIGRNGSTGFGKLKEKSTVKTQRRTMRITRADILKIGVLWALCAIVIAVGTMSGQTWKGGNTADYDANSVCSDVYLLHRLGTVFPTDTRAECCKDTVFTYTGIDTIYLEGGDTLILPVPPGYGHDTTVVMIVGGMHFTTWNDYVCDTLTFSIDTTVSPADTNNCVFCDSILNIAWFTIDTASGDSLVYDVWKTITGIERDSCGVLYSTGYINIEGDFFEGDFYAGDHIEYTWCEDCDTFIYNYYSDTLDWRFWLKDSTSGDVTLVEYDDTVVIGHPPIGIWVKECGCTTGVDTTITADSLDAFLCLSESWDVWTTIGGVYRSATTPIEANYGDPDLLYQNAWHTVSRSSTIGTSPNLVMTRAIDHDAYFQSYADTANAIFNAGDMVTLGMGDSTVDVGGVFFYNYDSTTAEYVAFQGDTALNWSGFVNVYAWDMYQPLQEFERHAYKFETSYDFTDHYSVDEISGMNDAQPEWYILPACDDIVPWVKINGEVFPLDTMPPDYGTKVYAIQPDLNYFEPMKITTGFFSKAIPYIGGQILFALHYGDTIINTTCWTFRDSIELPACGSTGGDCADSICIHWPQGWNPYGYDGNNVPTTQCFSVCDLDTIDITGVEYGVSFSGFALTTISEDSVDTFKIVAYNDSTVIMDADGDDDPLVIHMDTDFGASEIRFADGTQTDTTRLFQTADTFHIATDDTTIIVKVGSGSVYISDRALWFTGSTTADNYGFALGRNVDATGNYSAAWGDNVTASGNYSTAWGGFSSSASGAGATAWGIGTNSSGSGSTTWGNNTTASNEFNTAYGQFTNAFGNVGSTAWGNYCESGGAFSTVWGYYAKAYGDYSTAIGYEVFADSSANQSFLIGIGDTLSADSTFRSAYPYNEFKGAVKIEGLTLSNTDSILTIDGAGNIHYTPADSLGGASYELYVENPSSPTTSSAGGANGVTIGSNNVNNGISSFIGCGTNNVIGPGEDYNAIVGGSDNTIGGNGDYNFITGQNNTINAMHSFVCGISNSVTLSNSTSRGESFVLGRSNSITGLGRYGFLGGESNTYTGEYGIVYGSRCSSSGNYTLVLGDNVDIYTNYHTAFYDSVSPGYFTINTNDAVAPTVALEVGGGILSDSLSISGGDFISGFYVAGDSLFFIVGTDTMKVIKD